MWQLFPRHFMDAEEVVELTSRCLETREFVDVPVEAWNFVLEYLSCDVYAKTVARGNVRYHRGHLLWHVFRLARITASEVHNILNGRALGYLGRVYDRLLTVAASGFESLQYSRTGREVQVRKDYFTTHTMQCNGTGTP